jgi:hypothetical protein
MAVLSWENWQRLIDKIAARSGIYKRCFGNPDGRAVLKDLARVCHANATTWHEDASRRDVMIGYREIYLYIQRKLNLTPEEIAALGGFTIEKEND